MLYILAAATLWGLVGPVAMLALREGIAPLEIAFWRAAIAGVLYAVHALISGRWRLALRDVPAIVAFGLIGVSVFYSSYLLAVEAGGAALAAVLLYTAPAWVALLSWSLLREAPSRRRLMVISATVIGVALVATAGGGSVRITPSALGWGLTAGGSYALYYLFGRRYFALYPAAAVLALAVPVGALGLFPLVTFHPKSQTAWAALLFIAVVPTYAAYLLYAVGLRRLEATRAAVIATIEPVVAAAVAFAAFGERLAPLGYLGAAIVLGGVIIEARGAGGAVGRTGSYDEGDGVEEGEADAPDRSSTP